MEKRSNLVRVPFEALTVEQLAAFQAIYEASFPEWERDSWDEFVETAALPEYTVVAALVEGRVAGFWSAGLWDTPRVAYLAYLAVDPGLRSQGLGAELFAWFEGEYAGRASGLFWEVQARNVAGASTSYLEEAARRVAFYRRLGAVVVGEGPIEVPRVDSGEMELVELMWKGPALPDAATLRAATRALYLDAYGVDPADPLVARWA